MHKPIIAIDGPAGAGKSTIARLLAQKLNLLYVDTGAMYRALALKALRMGIMPEEKEKLAALAVGTNITLLENNEKNLCIMLDGEDVSEAIRTPEVTMLVSVVAMLPEVRLQMVELQRAIAHDCGVVMDGRDIGTFVFPQADIKFFLTASIEERSKRRYLELAAKGYKVDIENVTKELKARDMMDENRSIAPLKKADDAILINTTGLNINEVLTEMIACWRKE